jgi:hypothetical protein
MKFYHGTSQECWQKIQKEGVLWGTPSWNPTWGNSKPFRYTYLTPHKEIAKAYGKILLEVEYEPVGIDGRGIDNYGFDPPLGQTCWQFSVFIPILLDKIKLIENIFADLENRGIS